MKRTESEWQVLWNKGHLTEKYLTCHEVSRWPVRTKTFILESLEVVRITRNQLTSHREYLALKPVSIPPTPAPTS